MAPLSGIIGFTLGEAVRRGGQFRGGQQIDTSGRKSRCPKYNLPPQGPLGPGQCDMRR
jgi:hypothetical protein